MKKIIQVFTASFLAAGALAAASPASPLFEMRLALDTPSADSEQMTVVQNAQNKTPKQVFHVQKKVLLDQRALKTARYVRNPMGHPQIEIILTDDGAKRFAELTRQNVGKRLAIVIDGQLCSAPVIMQVIPGGQVEIQGSFSEQEAKALAAKINESVLK